MLGMHVGIAQTWYTAFVYLQLVQSVKIMLHLVCKNTLPCTQSRAIRTAQE